MSGWWHEQSFITPISQKSWSLMNPGTPNTQLSRHMCALLMVPMAVWRPPPNPTPHMHTITTSTLQACALFTQSADSVQLSASSMQCQNISEVPANTCSFWSASMGTICSLKHFFSVLEKLQDVAESLIRNFAVEIIALPWMHPTNNNTRCS